jgi:hypothetical protein
VQAAQSIDNKRDDTEVETDWSPKDPKPCHHHAIGPFDDIPVSTGENVVERIFVRVPVDQALPRPGSDKPGMKASIGLIKGKPKRPLLTINGRVIIVSEELGELR